MTDVVAGVLAELLAVLDEGTLVHVAATSGVGGGGGTDPADAGMRCVAAGGRIFELFGVDPTKLVGCTRDEVLSILAAAAATPLPSSGDASFVFDPIEIARPRARTLVWTSAPLTSAARGRVDVFRDVTRERHAERMLQQTMQQLADGALVDPATGLANARRFEEELLREHHRAQRAWESYSVARIATIAQPSDVAVDAALAAASAELRRGRREYDVIARVDVSEFALLLPGANGAATRSILQRIVAAFPISIEEAGRTVTVDARAGAAVWTPPSGERPLDLLGRAGEALERAGKSESHIDVDAGGGRFSDGEDGLPTP